MSVLMMVSTRRSSSAAQGRRRRCGWWPGTRRRAISSLAWTSRKLDVLREHCASVGRDYDEIEKTIQFRFDVGPDGEHVDALHGELKRFAELGIAHAQGVVAGAASIRPLELMGERVIPVAAGF